jgi:hypothetical protein
MARIKAAKKLFYDLKLRIGFKAVGVRLRSLSGFV